ncbi:hypothetical protein [Arthrobacter methylotrophus]|uniref:hypothetical protein n=1 Tax=Arthrobacter methylotrophus TaxID=121291 RepID=UPI0031EAFE38
MVIHLLLNLVEPGLVVDVFKLRHDFVRDGHVGPEPDAVFGCARRGRLENVPSLRSNSDVVAKPLAV